MMKSLASKTKPRTRAQWAACIRAECEQAVKEAIKGFLNLGRRLLAAKRASPHGEFLEMIEHDLPFTASKAQRLMKIASDPRLSKAAHGLHLPDSWRTLCELTKLDEETFDRAVSAGAIHPEMTRKDAKVISIRPVDKTIHIGPVPVYSKKTEPIPVSVTYERNEPTVLKFVAPAVDFLVQDILKALVAASINNASLPTVEEMEKFVRGYGQLQPGWLYNFAETMTALAQELERSEKASRLLSTSAG